VLTIPQLEEIQRHLADLSGLIDEFEARDFEFHQHALEWMRSLEVLLERHRLPQEVEVALLRAEIVLASGGCETDSVGRVSARTKRMRRDAAAADAVRRAGALVVEGIEGPRELLAQGEGIARQLAAVAKVKGITVSQQRDWSAASNAWHQVAADPDLVTAATHLVGLVGRTNAILMLLKAGDEV
jgi:hypothetical protein